MLATTKEPYVQGEKVKFERLYPAKEELQFNRGGIIFEPPKMLPESVLIGKLKAKNELKQKQEFQG